MKNDTYTQHILKNAALKKDLQFMPLLSIEFDQITLLSFKNEEDKMKEREQNSNFLMKKNDITCNSDINCKLE